MLHEHWQRAQRLCRCARGLPLERVALLRREVADHANRRSNRQAHLSRHDANAVAHAQASLHWYNRARRNNVQPDATRAELLALRLLQQQAGLGVPRATTDLGLLQRPRLRLRLVHNVDPPDARGHQQRRRHGAFQSQRRR